MISSVYYSDKNRVPYCPINIKKFFSTENGGIKICHSFASAA